jgi:hypothetical protein
MKVFEFRRDLQAAPTHELAFVLPNGLRIPAHAHITEVGRTDRQFLDCGGTVRRVSTCTLQAWVADDIEHRLLPGSLVTILGKAATILGTEALDVEVEFENGFISQFPVVSSRILDGVLEFQLGVKHTDCLAKEICLPAESPTQSGCCTPGGGCC